jgi:hypothetical protein
MNTQEITQKPARDLTIPQFHRRILCFDTETTGLMPKHKRGDPFPPDSQYPYIMQISWIVYNVATNLIEEVVNEYVKIPQQVEIEEGASKVSGITREITDTKGVDLAPLLIRFYEAYMKCDCIVAHNLHFDGEVVRKEMWRNRANLMTILKNQERVNLMTGVFTKKYNTAYHIDTFCTMMNTIDLCGIQFVPKEPAAVICESPEEPASASVPVPVPAQNNRKKFPSMKELYCKLFDAETQPKDLHNSIVDVLVCLRCFLKVRGAKEMSEKYFQRLVSQYSRPESEPVLE